MTHATPHHTNPEMPDVVQRLLHQALPPAFARSILSYAEFSERHTPENPKDFTAYHNACKAALGHVGALIKIREASEKSMAQPMPDKSENLEELLRQARRILSHAERP